MTDFETATRAWKSDPGTGERGFEGCAERASPMRALNPEPIGDDGMADKKRLAAHLVAEATLSILLCQNLRCPNLAMTAETLG